jgi:hypothetical protein
MCAGRETIEAGTVIPFIASDEATLRRLRRRSLVTLIKCGQVARCSAIAPRAGGGCERSWHRSAQIFNGVQRLDEV